MRTWLIIIFCLVWVYNGLGQQQSLNRTKSSLVKNDTLWLDTLTLVPGTVHLFSQGKLVDTSLYKVVPSKKAIVFNKEVLKKNPGLRDTLSTSYKVFPLDFSKEIYHKDIKEIQPDLGIPRRPFTINYNNSTSTTPVFFPSDGLTKNGSISRGISFGNNQDMVVNSNLNLQIAGKLTKDIEISLAATDNNIPVQPDGNSQQLQEFDKVYIQLKDKKSKLIVGDYQMQRPKSYFMSFYKRMQGLYFTNDYEIEKGVLLKSTVAGAIAGGRFARNVLQATEGNQGPYRLTGADNELFIVVLSGTERVYINGQLLKRGQENDYVIDYNSAQITFTAKQMLTKDRRIEIEFQYSAKSYSRSVYFVNEELITKKTRVAFNYYDEQDNKNKPLQQTLSDTDKVILYRVGDTLSKAYTVGYVPATFNSSDVFYKRLDTTVSSVTYKGIFVYTVNSSDTVFTVNYSYVGANQGDYIQIQSAANGKVYQWAAPVNGIKQGNYEPIIPLTAPTKKQMATAIVEYKTSATGLVGVEGAYTNYNVNTFSPYNKKNDDGQGVKAYYNDKKQLLPASDSAGSPLFFNYGATYEYVQKNFTQVERFRTVEFFRDWNRNNDTIYNDQHLASATLGISKGTLFSSAYTLENFTEGKSYQGNRHNIANSFRVNNTSGFFNASFLNTDNTLQKTYFYRHKSKITQKVKKFLLSYTDDFENNRFKYVPKDSLLSRSYQFWEWEGSVSNADTTKNKYKLSYRERTDKLPYHNSLYRAAYAQHFGLTTDINTIKNHPIRTTITFRKLQIIDTNLIKVKPDNNLLSRIEYSPKIMRGFFQANTFYEVNYGLEQKQQYSYVQVAAGQGQYTWKDYNGDGIKQLNEFEIAQYPDQAIYMKVYTPTNTYVKAARDQFSLSVYLRPAVFRREDSKKLMKFMSRFVSQTAYKVDQKNITDNQTVKVNPFKSNLNDTNLLASNYSLRQALYFNQASPIYGFDYTYEDNRTKQLLTNGYESHRLQNQQLRTRWNVTRAWGFFTTSMYGIKSSYAQLFSTRNYEIASESVEPKISYQPSTAFRISVSYNYTHKQNIITDGFQKAVLNDYAAEFKYNKLSKGSLNLKADYINITYNDDQNTPVAFDMLNSLHVGQNFTWSASYQQNLSGNIQISITYEGRKTPNYKLVHIGGMQVRAFF